MFHTFRMPGAPLFQYISALWISTAPAMAFRRERLLPDGDVHLVFPLTDSLPEMYAGPHGALLRRFNGPLICGIHTHDLTIDTAAQRHLMGVVFKAGGSQSFFGVPSRLLYNQVIPLEDIWGPQARRLHQRLRQADKDAQRFALLEHALRGALHQPLSSVAHPAVAVAVHQLTRTPTQRISLLADALGLSQRRFQQVFTDAVGVTPKVFARLQRFHALLQRLHLHSAANWPTLAQEMGYYDQAHLIHEFRALASMTPDAYLRSERRLPHHLPVAPVVTDMPLQQDTAQQGTVQRLARRSPA